MSSIPYRVLTGAQKNTQRLSDEASRAMLVSMSGFMTSLGREDPPGEHRAHGGNTGAGKSGTIKQRKATVLSLHQPVFTPQAALHAVAEIFPGHGLT